MTTELTAESTHEDITSAVEAIIKDRQGDETKGDAQRIAEERDKPVGDTSAESDAGSDETASDGEETGTETPAEWLDDDLKAEIATYGINEKELSDFTSREEVERALRFFDKSALEAGRKALAEGDGEKPTRDEHGKFAKKDEPAEETKDGKYEIGLDKDIYDEDLVNELTHMRDHYESRLGALETRLAEQDAKADEQLFDTLVDASGHADLFGVTGKENSKQLQRRQDLHVAVKAQQIGLKVMGRSVDLDQSLVHRVARMVFAEDIGKKELKARTRKLSQQSSQRMGGGATRPSGPAETLRDELRHLYKELDAG